jgi:hypothetical protein
VKGYPEPVLDPKAWDEEMVESVEAVRMGLIAARELHESLFPAATNDPGRKLVPTFANLLELYDRIQDQLRIPVMITAPEGDAPEATN